MWSARGSVSTRPSDEDAGAAVEDVYGQLTEGPMRDVRVAMLHGRLAAEEKDDVMGRFVAGKVDVLIATTVIEVGVDVPNAAAMVICDADRFGISQLHQLRGRIGRGEHPGVCLLLTGTPPDTPAAQRLAAVAGTRDGFALATVDLEQRREGDVLGAEQSGVRSSLRHLRVLEDEDLITYARDLAATAACRRTRSCRIPAWPTSSTRSSGGPPATGSSARDNQRQGRKR